MLSLDTIENLILNQLKNDGKDIFGCTVLSASTYEEIKRNRYVTYPGSSYSIFLDPKLLIHSYGEDYMIRLVKKKVKQNYPILAYIKVANIERTHINIEKRTMFNNNVRVYSNALYYIDDMDAKQITKLAKQMLGGVEDNGEVI